RRRGGRRGAGGPPPGPRGMSPLEALAQDLELDSAQRQDLRTVFDHYADARRERVREIQKVRDAMVAELQKPDFDMAKIDPLIEQMTQLRGEAQKQNMRAIAELSTKLKPEQRERLHKILADRYGNPPWAGGRPPGRPPPEEHRHDRSSRATWVRGRGDSLLHRAMATPPCACGPGHGLRRCAASAFARHVCWHAGRDTGTGLVRLHNCGRPYARQGPPRGRDAGSILG